MIFGDMVTFLAYLGGITLFCMIGFTLAVLGSRLWKLIKTFRGDELNAPPK